MALILILDDRATNRNIYARLAAAIEPGIVAEVFADPLDALEWLQANRVDLVITDYRMPGMDGAEFTRRFRAMPNGALAPVMVVTAYDDRSFRLRALDAGATDFLQTPIDHFELVTRARNLLALGRQATPPHAGTLAAGIAPGPDRSRLGTMAPPDAAGRAPATPAPAIPAEPPRPAPARNPAYERPPGFLADQPVGSAAGRPAAELPAGDLARILDSLPVLVSLADRNGIILYVNAALAGWVGRPTTELIGRPAAVLSAPDRAARGRRDDLAVFETGQALPPRQETRAGVDGVLRNLLVLKTPLRDADGGTLAVLTAAVELPVPFGQHDAGPPAPPTGLPTDPPWGVADA